MRPMHCRNESEGFTLVQRHFIGMQNRRTREKKYRGKPYPGLLPASIGKLREALVRRTNAVLEWARQYRSTATAGELPEVLVLRRHRLSHRNRSVLLVIRNRVL